MFAETMQRDTRRFIVCSAIEVSAIVFEMLINVESSFGRGSVFKQVIASGRNHVLILVPISCGENPFYLQYVFRSCINRIHVYTVVKRKLFIRFQGEAEIDGIFYRRG